jgi:hypothetical protein
VAGKRSRFLEQIQRAREAAQASAVTETTSKPTEELSDAELEEALTAARRNLLDAQHAELREREIARVSGAGKESASATKTTLQDVLREKQRGKRRTWR